MGHKVKLCQMSIDPGEVTFMYFGKTAAATKLVEWTEITSCVNYRINKLYLAATVISLESSRNVNNLLQRVMSIGLNLIFAVCSNTLHD